jgi:hypothetical protein
LRAIERNYFREAESLLASTPAVSSSDTRQRLVVMLPQTSKATHQELSLDWLLGKASV